MKIERAARDSYDLRSHRVPIVDRANQKNRESIEKMKRVLERGMAGFAPVSELMRKREKPFPVEDGLVKQEERLKALVQLQSNFGVSTINRIINNALSNGTPTFHKRLREFNHLLKEPEIDASAVTAKFRELKDEL